VRLGRAAARDARRARGLLAQEQHPEAAMVVAPGVLVARGTLGRVRGAVVVREVAAALVGDGEDIRRPEDGQQPRVSRYQPLSWYWCTPYRKKRRLTPVRLQQIEHSFHPLLCLPDAFPVDARANCSAKNSPTRNSA